MAKDILRESKGFGQTTKETWWWNTGVREATIKLKRESYTSLPKCRDNASYENYKVAKTEGKKVVQEAKCKAYDKLYNELGTKEGEKHFINLLR